VGDRRENPDRRPTFSASSRFAGAAGAPGPGRARAARFTGWICAPPSEPRGGRGPRAPAGSHL